MNNQTIYNKVEVLLKTKVYWGEKDPRVDSTEKREFEDAMVDLSGNYLIISTTETKENNEEIVSSVVFPLDIVIIYRTTL